MALSPAGSKLKAAGVRFATEGTQGHRQEGTKGHPQEGTHVHFQEQLHDSAVMVTQDKDGHFLVKVGDRGTAGRCHPPLGTPGAPKSRKFPDFEPGIPCHSLRLLPRAPTPHCPVFSL